MITQQHEIQQKAQAPTPVKEHLWIVVLFSILGVALPLAGGWWVAWPLVDIFPTLEPPMSSLVAGVVLVVVPVTVGAFLLCFAFRAWWVALFAAVAWGVGEFLSWLVSRFVEGSSSQLLAWDFLSGHLILIVLVAVPTLIGMALGGAVGLELGKRRASHQ